MDIYHVLSETTHKPINILERVTLSLASGQLLIFISITFQAHFHLSLILLMGPRATGSKCFILSRYNFALPLSAELLFLCLIANSSLNARDPNLLSHSTIRHGAVKVQENAFYHEQEIQPLSLQE